VDVVSEGAGHSSVANIIDKSNMSLIFVSMQHYAPWYACLKAVLFVGRKCGLSFTMLMTA
jgi:hypothetical protein